MRELARIQFRGDAKDFISAWNTQSTLQIEQRVVALYKDEPDYAQMSELFANFTQQHAMTWFERVEIEYSEQELLSFDLLVLHIVGQAGMGNNALAPVYTVKPICDTCGRVEYNQTHNLVLNLLEGQDDPLETGYFQHDICETDFHEVVVSQKIKALFEQNQVKGIGLRTIEHISDMVVANPYYQLLVEPQIGALVGPSPIRRLDPCETCGQYKQVLLGVLAGTRESEFYFSKSSYVGDWIMKTTDRFGRVPNFSSKIVISQQLYRLLKEHNITGFWVQPAHLV